ncbi:RNA-binding S4 domain-containing protein [Eubacteriales bacterium mix99]
MRLDKFLKISRIIKRRTLANEACSRGRVQVNGKVAKPSGEVQVGDVIRIQFGDQVRQYEVLLVANSVPRGDVARMVREI